MSQTTATTLDRRAVLPMVPGLIATAAVLVGFVVDHTTWHTIDDQVIAPGGVTEDSLPLYVFQYIVGGLGVLSWLVSIAGVLLRRPWVVTFATGAFACGLAAALYTLVARGFAGFGYPTRWGLLLLVPCLPGALAVILLHRSRGPVRR